LNPTGLDDPAAFVRANTKPGRLPFIDEISLHLAHEVVPLWTETETLRQGAMPPPYWAFAWAGGQALARYLLDNPGEVRGQRALDFGAGSGLVGIAAAKSGAIVTCADIDRLSIAAIQLNAAINGVSLTTTDANVLDSEEHWPLILVGDMCYERPLAERLLSWLRLQAKAGGRILLGDPGRSYFPTSGLRRLATYSVPTPKDLEDRDIRETSVYFWQE
jgi:predicted nicotinamide N-methyase